MTLKQLEKLVARIENEPYDYDAKVQKQKAIPNKLATNVDLHAMNLIDRLVPGGGSVSWAEHDEYALSVRLDELAKVATEAQIREIMLCGFFIDVDDGRVWSSV
jgi:hypothetical protein